jgi:putative oxidoreductase
VFGLLTPIAAALVPSVMAVAAISAHVKQGFFITAGGFEYNLVLGAAGLAAAFTGPGSYSLDAALGFSVSGVVWGLGALLVGVAGAVLQLSRRRSPSTSPATAA